VKDSIKHPTVSTTEPLRAPVDALNSPVNFVTTSL